MNKFLTRLVESQTEDIPNWDTAAAEKYAVKGEGYFVRFSNRTSRDFPLDKSHSTMNMSSQNTPVGQYGWDMNEGRNRKVMFQVASESGLGDLFGTSRRYIHVFKLKDSAQVLSLATADEEYVPMTFVKAKMKAFVKTAGTFNNFRNGRELMLKMFDRIFENYAALLKGELPYFEEGDTAMADFVNDVGSRLLAHLSKMLFDATAASGSTKKIDMVHFYNIIKFFFAADTGQRFDMTGVFTELGYDAIVDVDESGKYADKQKLIYNWGERGQVVVLNPNMIEYVALFKNPVGIR